MPDLRNVVIIGGGLAGLTAAYWAVRQGMGQRVVVLERGPAPLAWMKGTSPNSVLLGRTGKGAPPAAEEYPTGWPELERILEKWPGNANRDWLLSLGLPLESFEDGAFGTTDGARFGQEFLAVLEGEGVEIRTRFGVETISVQPDGTFRVWSRDGWSEEGQHLLLATGGDRNHGLKLAGELGLPVNPPLAAFIRLKLASPRLGSRLGPVTRHVGLRCVKSGQESTGEITLSPRGLEGSAVSNLSAPLVETTPASAADRDRLVPRVARHLDPPGTGHPV